MTVTWLGLIPFCSEEFRFTREEWKALASVAEGMARQNKKFLINTHPPEKWQVILGEEFGEVCREVYDLAIHPIAEPGSYGHKGLRARYRDELRDVAAVATAAIADDLTRNRGA
jgi:hypothetical protein